MVKMTKSKQPHPNKQRVPTQLKSDDKDDKDLAHTGPSKGCPSLGRASLTSLGRLENTKRKLFY